MRQPVHVIVIALLMGSWFLIQRHERKLATSMIPAL